MSCLVTLDRVQLNRRVDGELGNSREIKKWVQAQEVKMKNETYIAIIIGTYSVISLFGQEHGAQKTKHTEKVDQLRTERSKMLQSPASL